MTGPKRTKHQREYDKQIIAEMYLKRHSQRSIAEMLGLTQPQISYDLKKIMTAWQEQAIESLDEAKAMELARINHLEQTYWQRWETTKRDVLLDGVLKCIGLRMKLLGLEEHLMTRQMTLTESSAQIVMSEFNEMLVDVNQKSVTMMEEINARHRDLGAGHYRVRPEVDLEEEN